MKKVSMLAAALLAVTLAGCNAAKLDTPGKHVEPPSVTSEAQKPMGVTNSIASPVTASESRTEASEATYKKAYELMPAERDLIERVVMAEAGGESKAGQLAVAQCIRNACELEDKRPAEVVDLYKYTDVRRTPSESVKEAVSVIFDMGVTVLPPDTLYFYAPDVCVSEWHESQEYICTIEGHRFFAAKED